MKKMNLPYFSVPSFRKGTKRYPWKEQQILEDRGAAVEGEEMSAIIFWKLSVIEQTGEAQFKDKCLYRTESKYTRRVTCYILAKIVNWLLVRLSRRLSHHPAQTRVA